MVLRCCCCRLVRETCLGPRICPRYSLWHYEVGGVYLDGVYRNRQLDVLVVLWYFALQAHCQWSGGTEERIAAAYLVGECEEVDGYRSAAVGCES
jgi:hypothetical protein